MTMKKILMTMLCGLMMSVAAQAQTVSETPFSKGKVYAAASLSGLGLSYSKSQDWYLGVHGKGGYLIEDNWMITGNVGYDYRKASYNSFSAGAGLRYYIEQNGLYLGAGGNYYHEHGYDDFMPTIQLGYAYFLNRTVTIEPEIYYNQSLKNHSEYSGFGVRIGIGIYFE